MIVLSAVTALALLALVTQAGVLAVQRSFPPQGRMIEVDGATLHVVDIGPRGGLPIVMLHGASSNLEVMRHPLGEMLAGNHRVILIDRPGHGWSTRARLQDSTPDIQARIIDEALGKLGIDRAVFVAHSWSGALGARLALDHASRVAGLVMLAPVTYPWRGGVGRYNEIIATPVIGTLLAYTITLPLGYFITGSGARDVFLPQTMPDGFVKESATPLLLRPREFIANAYDLVTLKASVAAQAPRYGEIGVPVTIIAGEPDKTVKTDIHARPFAATVPNTKLIVLPDLGHMVQNAVPDLVKAEIETMIRMIAPVRAAAD
ncbi:alpha/beta hydrolase [Bradyrhizobium sp. BR13661]|jgi:pimeloyl-ACP methyl ester carboxylesterase|uniref:alpha/beta fold hydrolase n=1 Tax=Bradyrhizobium sp. BR13661 TaxID=2940622 RepID=UPI002473805B|nr:alpha/beta hydrolase [Bradyrhizobium sp. BR13661]MDH6261159.1 pimeloyl-ACP methyl ester carboxylesterase [Bradyrhizobium sp. BR13661]